MGEDFFEENLYSSADAYGTSDVPVTQFYLKIVTHEYVVRTFRTSTWQMLILGIPF